MTDMENFNQEYERIIALQSSPLIARELKLKSYEFREAYKSLRAKTRNGRHRTGAKDLINERRREKYKADKEAKKSPIISVIPKVEIADVNTEIKRENPAVKRDVDELSENTKIAYIGVIKRVYRHFKNEELNEKDHLLKYLNGEKYNTSYIFKNHSYIIEKAESIFSTFQSDIPHLYSVFSKFKGQITRIAEKLYPFMKAVNKNYVENRGRDVYVNEDAVKKVSFETEKVLENMEKLNDDEKLLYALTFLLPTRRLHDYRFMRHTNNADEEIAKTSISQFHSYNWIVGGNIMYINYTKNKQAVIIPLSENVKKYVMVYANKPNNTEGWVLGANYTPHGLTRKYTKIMEKLYGYNFSPQDIRRIYCTASVRNVNTLNELREDATAVGHSLAEHIAYVLPGV